MDRESISCSVRDIIHLGRVIRGSDELPARRNQQCVHQWRLICLFGKLKLHVVALTMCRAGSLRATAELLSRHDVNPWKGTMSDSTCIGKDDAERRVLTFSQLFDPPSYHVFTSVINPRIFVHLDSEIIIRDNYYECHGHNYVSLIITFKHLYLSVNLIDAIMQISFDKSKSCVWVMIISSARIRHDRNRKKNNAKRC